MEQLQFKLTEYEGPLDLLLELIRKNKLNIHDIEISVLLEQYMDYIAQMHAMSLEIATEFIIMAARLIYIKTKSLLPRNEEPEKLKRELQGQLLELQWCKIVAGELASMYKGSDVFVRKQMEIELSQEDSYYKRLHHVRELIEAYMISLGRSKRNLMPAKSSFTEIISPKVVDIKVGKMKVLEKLIRDGRVLYDEFFAEEEKGTKIATFLAMLDLLKGSRIVISEDGKYVEFNKEYIKQEKDVSMEELEAMFLEEDENIKDEYSTVILDSYEDVDDFTQQEDNSTQMQDNVELSDDNENEKELLDGQ